MYTHTHIYMYISIHITPPTKMQRFLPFARAGGQIARAFSSDTTLVTHRRTPFCGIFFYCQLVPAMFCLRSVCLFCFFFRKRSIHVSCKSTF